MFIEFCFVIKFLDVNSCMFDEHSEKNFRGNYDYLLSVNHKFKVFVA